LDARTVLSPCVCTSVRRASRILARAYDASLSESGMNVTQLAVMRAILRHPGEPLTKVAEDLAMDRTSLYRTLLPMQRLKWVRLKEGRDRRSLAAAVAEAGKIALARADSGWARTQTAIIQQFGPGSWKSFVSELNRLVECANALPESRQGAVKST